MLIYTASVGSVFDSLIEFDELSETIQTAVSLVAGFPIAALQNASRNLSSRLVEGNLDIDVF